MTTPATEDAGPFAAWLDTIDGVLRRGDTSDVPCRSCTACCTSSQFIHIAPDEVDALRAIPEEVLVPAPRLPAGHVLMGYDEHGRCPMLVDGACSIYAHRPRTCRTYDCRVFAATGVALDDPTKSAIDDRVGRWRFGLVDDDDRARLQAVRAAASLLRELEPGWSATRRALAALELHDLFLTTGPDGHGVSAARPDPESVKEELRRRRPA